VHFGAAAGSGAAGIAGAVSFYWFLADRFGAFGQQKTKLASNIQT
jgi:hypothetical protein